ncbi:MAG TPA: YdeI/OmpD-associated family protein, partial [Vicinamibacterales bacterium]|nr:YdeI/OmpD-associated family protein [Vicinamibacterales bacterium]
MIRFTPRKPGSNWSTVNTRRATGLIEAGRMQPAGLKAFEARDPEKSAAYSFEQRKTAALSPQEKTRFRRSPRAWAFFESQPPGYRRIVIWWVVSAKRQETRARRLGTLIEDSSNGRRIGLLRRNEP